MERGYGDNRIIGENGVRLGDSLLITPMQGRTRRFKLNRTAYHFQRGEGLSIEGFTVSLPSTNEVSFQLILCSSKSASRDELKRYLIRSSGNHPFRLNGSYVYEAFLERGDRVELGYNRLHFGKSTSKEVTSEVLSNGPLMESDLSILIEGETGTGKSYLASQIHGKSGRLGAFIHLNLSSFSLNLVESELFGHVKGAFTGAVGQKRGAILEADRGTLFLDEIDSLPLELQTKILLFLDSKEVRPVGGSTSYRSDVRLIFASGRSLRNLVSQGQIRKDLYYRLKSGASLELAPLRKRPNHLEALAEEFACSHNLAIAPQLIHFYKGLHWEGNIRQFLGHLEKKRVIERGNKLIYSPLDEALLLGDSVIPKAEGEIMSLETLKRNYTKRVFNQFDGNFSQSARALGVTINTVRRLISNI